jgi:hypothetical protein
MIKKKLLYIFLIFAAIFVILGTYLIFSDYDNKKIKFIKDNTPFLIKEFLRKTIFYIPIHYRNYQALNIENIILTDKNNLLYLENLKYKNLLEFGKKEKFKINLKNKTYQMTKYRLPFFNKKDIYANKTKGYLEIHKNKIIVTFGSGKIIYLNKDDLNKEVFTHKIIPNNLLDLDLFNQKIKWTGIKDTKIINDKIFISVTKEIKKNCYTISVLSAKINLDFLKFEDFFDSDQCVSTDKEIKAFKYFAGYQTGGRITNYRNDLILTVGDFNDWTLPQNKDSIFGKILAIDLKSKKSKILSLGHRNPQGLFLVNDRKLLVSTEHGPKGGDEVNIIKLIHEDSQLVKNYGWPKASYGVHYDVVPINSFTKKIAPLYKSHKKYGFIEPAKVFTPSIGISEIISYELSENKNSYFVSSLKEKKLFKLNFDNEFKNPKIDETLVINERIRDIIFDKSLNKYYMYLENTPSIGILSIKN